MKILELESEMSSGNNEVFRVKMQHPLTGQISELFETHYMPDKEAQKLFTMFYECEACRPKGYHILKRFGKLMYSGDDIQSALKARMN